MRILNFFIKNHFNILILTLGIILLILNSSNLSIIYLRNHSIDEWAFYGVWNKMYNGILEFNLKEIFSFTFYSYGFLYFGFYLIILLPGFIFDNPETVVFTGRIVNSAFALISLVFIHKILSQQIDRIKATISIFFIISFPSFWKTSLWNHPDWMMIALSIISIYFIIKDRYRFEKYFNISVFFWALAVTVKIQALNFSVLYFFYFITFFLKEKNFNARLILLYKLIRPSFIFLITFFSINAYLFHPLGFKAFQKSFITSVNSTNTAHFTFNEYSVKQKFELVISEYFFDYHFLILFMIILGVYFIKSNKHEDIIAQSVYGFIFFWLLYLLLKVNNIWDHYYLIGFVLLPIALTPILKIKSKSIFIIFTIIIFINLLNLSINFHNKVLQSHDIGKVNDYKKNELTKIVDFINEDLKKFNSTPFYNILISPYLPFDLDSNNLNYQNIHIIYGNIQEYMFNEKPHIKKYNNRDFVKKDFILLSKKDDYFNSSLNKYKTQDNNFIDSVKLVNTLISGNGEYIVLNQNEYYYLLKLKEK